MNRTNIKSALVVDDSKSARFALRKYLERHAFQVEAVESAEEAYRYLSRHRPDVIFLDHVMPGADGFEVLHRLKSEPRTVTIPVVICSSDEGEEFVQRARSRGAAGVLPKPPTPAQLAKVLEALERVATPKVAPIRQPEVAIEQQVMKTVRRALPAAASPAPPAAAHDEFAKHVQALRDQFDSRLRKLTQEFFNELGALKAQIAHLGSEPGAADVRAIAREEADMLRSAMHDQLAEIRESLAELKRAREAWLAEARAAAAEQAQQTAERTMMNAAARISDQLAQSILSALGRPEEAAGKRRG